ncbi:AMP-binding protein [Wenyingzhuangia sp. IMCC45533]
MHSSFKLNGQDFETVEELIDFSGTISKELSAFLSQWFDDNLTLTVQTSGSTGKPKPIKIKKEFMKNSAKATGAFFDLGAETKALCCLSVNYIAGKMMVVRALELGWHLDFTAPVSNPLEYAFKTYDFCAMVPMQVKASLWDLHLVKKLLIGGGVVSQGLQAALQNIKTECFASYGMTETVTHIAVKRLNKVTSSDLDKRENRIEKSGGVRAESRTEEYYQVLPNISISQDDRGCLVVNAPLLSDKQVITNDMIKQHSASEFEWLGRYDNVINSGGVKLHPEQIEKEISKIMNQRFFVAGIPDEVLGEKLVLVVEGKPRKLDLSVLSLSKFQSPKEVFYIDKFIETETKKIQREKTLLLLDDKEER